LKECDIQSGVHEVELSSRVRYFHGPRMEKRVVSTPLFATKSKPSEIVKLRWEIFFIRLKSHLTRCIYV